MAIALLASTAAPAIAAERLIDAQFLRASQCLAHLEASEAEPPGAAGFAGEIGAQDRGRAPHLLQNIRDDARAIARQWRRTDTAEKGAGMAERKAAACAGFDALRTATTPDGPREGQRVAGRKGGLTPAVACLFRSAFPKRHP
jgi:hypothetical protein